MKKAALALAVLVIAGVVFAVAQGGDSGGGNPLNAIAKAAEVTQREPGGRAELEVEVTGTNSTERLSEKGSMIFDENGRTRGNITVTVAGKEVKMDSVTEGAKAYMSSDQLQSQLPDGEKWMLLDLSHAVKGAPSPSSAPSPQEGLKTLEGVLDAKKVGTESIDGEPTTHYTGTLPVAEKVFGVKLHASAPEVDVWIDSQDRVRQIEIDVTGSAGNSEEAVTTHMTFDYVEFGRVPKISLPNPEEVFDATGEVEESVQSAAEGG